MEHKANFTTYSVLSDGGVYAPGLIAWLINGYRFEKDRPAMIKIAREFFSDKLPDNVLDMILSERIPYWVKEQDTVYVNVEHNLLRLPDERYTQLREGPMDWSY